MACSSQLPLRFWVFTGTAASWVGLLSAQPIKRDKLKKLKSRVRMATSKTGGNEQGRCQVGPARLGFGGQGPVIFSFSMPKWVAILKPPVFRRQHESAKLFNCQ